MNLATLSGMPSATLTGTFSDPVLLSIVVSIETGSRLRMEPSRWATSS